jgi:hypothetical protein
MMSLRHGWGWQMPQTASLRHIQSVWAHWYAVHGHMAVASNSYTNSTWVIFWGYGSLVESKWCHYIMVRVHSHLNCFLHPYSTYAKCLSTLIYCLGAYKSSLKQLYPHYFCQILGFWVTCGVEMASLHHGLGWQPTQNTSCIHIIHIHSVWAHWYAVHAHMVVASNSYTHPSWLILCGSGSLVESEWCHYVMVDADSQLKLLPTSKLYIYKVFENIDMLSMGIW